MTWIVFALLAAVTVAMASASGTLRAVLRGFAPTDLATGGTVKFDDVGLYVR
jgi:hypothetical protein